MKNVRLALCVIPAVSFLAGLLAWLGSVTTQVQAAPRREAAAGAVRAGFNRGSFLANDDDSLGPVQLGFDVNFFGLNFNQTVRQQQRQCDL